MLGTLHLLENDGVEIFYCGTCLEYYQLKDKLQVGQVTNIYDTIASLLSTGKLVSI